MPARWAAIESSTSILRAESSGYLSCCLNHGMPKFTSLAFVLALTIGSIASLPRPCAEGSDRVSPAVAGGRGNLRGSKQRPPHTGEGFLKHPRPPRSVPLIFFGQAPTPRHRGTGDA